MEEISLIDVHLVVHSVNEVGLDWLFKIFQRFKVGDLSESDCVVIEKLYSSGWPSFESSDHDSDRPCIDTSEVQSLNAIGDVLNIRFEGCFNSDELLSIYWIFQIELSDVLPFNLFELHSVESNWILLSIELDSYEFVLPWVLCFPSFGTCTFLGCDWAICIVWCVGRTEIIFSDSRGRW